ncbi:hypothetical protein Cgig2_008392 [Carnegiea gigantea]|uniref:Uncharacterized protein n=1 Tax=Carnegiea gigantea TaxID=171969 RepID=A0A9Q1KEB7_9CARY|nr:hypothetical protein Cgig2_008392 [Carnegiea gigantea]
MDPKGGWSGVGLGRGVMLAEGDMGAGEGTGIGSWVWCEGEGTERGGGRGGGKGKADTVKSDAVEKPLCSGVAGADTGVEKGGDGTVGEAVTEALAASLMAQRRSFKFILTFPSVAKMEEVLDKHEQLDLWFINVKKWDQNDYCEIRRVCRFNTIDGDLIISLEDAGYRIKVKEIGSAIQVIQTTDTLATAPSMEAMDSSDGVVGFKGIEDDVAAADDVACSDLRRNDMVVAEQDGELSDQEDLIVWMRIAALPNFRKLYGKIHDDLNEGDVIVVNLMNNYNTYLFGGKKKLVLTTENWLGGANDFLGVAYIFMGAFCLVVSLIITLLQMKNPR